MRITDLLCFFAFIALTCAQSIISVTPNNLPAAGGKLTVTGSGFEENNYVFPDNYEIFEAAVYPSNGVGNGAICSGVTRIAVNKFTCNLSARPAGNNPSTSYYFYLTIQMVGGWTYGDSGFFTYSYQGTLPPTVKPTPKPTSKPTPAPAYPIITSVTPNVLPRATGGKLTVTGSNLMSSDYYLFHTSGNGPNIFCTGKTVIASNKITCNVGPEPIGSDNTFSYSFGALVNNYFYPTPNNIWEGFFNYN